MSLFRKKKVTITEKDPTYKVRYLGNVQTTMMKGDGCVDKPTLVLWNNYTKSSSPNPGIDMKLSICATGMKAMTKEQGLTEYRAHRISYYIAHPNYPKLFVWVYRHEGKKMKVELRCHAVLCKSESKAKAMAVQLHEKLIDALQEFRREKTRRQNTRLLLQRTNSMPLPSGKDTIGLEMTTGLPARTKFLSPGQNFKPPVDRSSSAPKLGNITEDGEAEMAESMQDDSSSEEEDIAEPACVAEGGVEEDTEIDLSVGETPGDIDEDAFEDIQHQVVDFQVGNDINELKQDSQVQKILSRKNSDSDDDSSESSGFSEQEQRELISANKSTNQVTQDCKSITKCANGDTNTFSNCDL